MLYFSQATRPDRVRETFELLREGRVAVAMSRAVLSEIRDVLAREEYRDEFPALTDEAVAAFLREVLGLTRMIRKVPHVYTVERDPKDSKYVDLAAAAGASYLVTRDRDLLDLMKHTTRQGREFRRRFRKLIILEPGDFCREITVGRA